LRPAFHFRHHEASVNAGTAGPYKLTSVGDRYEIAPSRSRGLPPLRMKLCECNSAFTIAAKPWTRRSLYLKVRDRESYEFALASAAVALDLQDGRVREARIALGGVATQPWRAREAEKVLADRPFDQAAATAAAEAAFQGAAGREHNAFKITLGKRTLVRALHQAATMELPT